MYVYIYFAIYLHVHCTVTIPTMLPMLKETLASMCACHILCLCVNVHSSSWDQRACRPPRSPKPNKLPTSTSKTCFVSRYSGTTNPTTLIGPLPRHLTVQILSSNHTLTCCTCSYYYNMNTVKACGSVAEHQREYGGYCACKQSLWSKRLVI